MSKLNQLLNIEVGTFKRQGNKLILELNHNQFRYDQLSELNELKQADSKFLQLVNVVEQDQKVVLTYALPDKVRSLKNLPHENKAIRAAIAKEIMAQNVVNDSQYHIALNPANLWYYPMQHVWYAYRANELMPYDDKHSNLAKYKALILFCLTGTPYERLLSNPQEALAKHPDDYLQQVAKATSLNELTEVVNGIEDFVSYHEWQEVETAQQKTKQRLWLSMAGVAIVAVLAVGLVHKSDERKYQSLANQNQAQVTRLKYNNQIQTALNNHQWSKAKKTMQKAGYKVPANMGWFTGTMASDAKGSHQYLKQISENDAKAGDIVIVNQGAGAGNNGHTAILLGKWQGKATKIIEQGGTGDKVNESTFGTAFYSLLNGSDVTLARPIKK